MNKLISTTMLILLSSFSIMCSNNSIDNFKFDINLYEKETNLDATALISYSDKSVTKDTYIINFWFPSCAPCAKELPHFQKLYPCRDLFLFCKFFNIFNNAALISKCLRY